MQQDESQQPIPSNRSAGRQLLVVGVLAAIVAGVGVYFWQQSEMNQRTERLSRAQAMRENNLRESLKPQIELKNEVVRLQDEVSVLRQFAYRAPAGFRPELLEVYDCDVHYNTYVGFCVVVPEDLPLLQKVRFLADRLSTYRFRSLPIEVLEIENRKGKHIAVIDLQEDDRSIWSTYYFQGSTGGHMTQTILTKTLLQPDYRGEWIDGVEFYYEGKPMEEWDHINLTGTILREDVESIRQ